MAPKLRMSQKRSQWSQQPCAVIKGLSFGLGPGWETWGQTTKTEVKVLPIPMGHLLIPQPPAKASQVLLSVAAEHCSSSSGLNKSWGGKATPQEWRLRKHCRESRGKEKKKRKKGNLPHAQLPRVNSLTHFSSKTSSEEVKHTIGYQKRQPHMAAWNSTRVPWQCISINVQCVSEWR